jgi:MFS family permease
MRRFARMGDGRAQGARHRDSQNPAAPAGFFAARERMRGAFGDLRRPAMRQTVLSSYRRERLYDATYPIVGALMEGGFLGVIADKVYHVHPAVLALVSAAPMFGNLSSGLWARLAHGRRKVPLILALQSLVVLAAGAVALLPETGAGAWSLVSLQIASRLILGGVVTVRSLVWTLNYPRMARARVTSRLTIVATLTMTLTALIGSVILDASPATFRAVYAAGALLSMVGVIAFSGVRLTDEEAHLRLERGADDGVEPEGAAGPRGVVAVLRADPLFARYQALQFLLGTANMMIEAPLIYLVSRELGASYTISIAMTLVLPLSLSVLTMGFWASWFDQVHVARFRSRHSWLFVLAQLLTWIGALAGSLVWIGLARVIGGVARGGGAIAWQLGHNDFADPQRVGLYMGAHASLTGLRGLVAPFLGMALYVGWEGFSLPGTSLRVPEFGGIGAGVMGVSTVLSAIASLGYVDLSRRIEAKRREAD